MSLLVLTLLISIAFSTWVPTKKEAGLCDYKDGQRCPICDTKHADPNKNCVTADCGVTKYTVGNLCYSDQRKFVKMTSTLKCSMMQKGTRALCGKKESRQLPNGWKPPGFENPMALPQSQSEGVNHKLKNKIALPQSQSEGVNHKLKNKKALPQPQSELVTPGQGSSVTEKKQKQLQAGLKNLQLNNYEDVEGKLRKNGYEDIDFLKAMNDPLGQLAELAFKDVRDLKIVADWIVKLKGPVPVTPGHGGLKKERDEHAKHGNKKKKNGNGKKQSNVKPDARNKLVAGLRNLRLNNPKDVEDKLINNGYETVSKLSGAKPNDLEELGFQDKKDEKRVAAWCAKLRQENAMSEYHDEYMYDDDVDGYIHGDSYKYVNNQDNTFVIQTIEFLIFGLSFILWSFCMCIIGALCGGIITKYINIPTKENSEDPHIV